MLTTSIPVSVRSFQSAGAVPNRSEQILLELPQALMVLRPDCQLVFANANARALLESGRAHDLEGRLIGIGQLGASPLEALLRRAQEGNGARVGLWFPAMRTGWLSASPVPTSITGSADWPSDSLLLLVHLDEPGLSQPARIEALCQRCGLTRTERYVLLLLADGMVAQEIARQLALRISTVRTHIRNLLGKTRSPSLMQLVRQVGSTEPLEEFH